MVASVLVVVVVVVGGGFLQYRIITTRNMVEQDNLTLVQHVVEQVRLG